MLDKHRRRHVLMWTLLAPLVLSGAIYSLLTRRPIPVQPPLPSLDTSSEVQK